MLNPKLIAIDWGSTYCRGYLLDESGGIIAQQDKPKGILQVRPEEFENIYTALVGDWLDLYPKTPVMMSGMVGSQQGWMETPYVPLPAGLDELAQSLIRVPLTTTSFEKPAIVSGVVLDNAHYCDVMRGEETQVVGALSLSSMSAQKQMLCLPGTHSKWVTVENQQISFFATYMTGELFSLLCEKSILAKTAIAPKGFNKEVFARGFKEAYNLRGLLTNLFTIRARTLRQHLNPCESFDYLSGLLIGDEIKHATLDESEKLPITLIASKVVGERYQYALSLIEKKATLILSEKATTRGLWTIAQSAHFI
jgi:2-dehydro-3-deoxygalactonokinase